MAIKWRKIAATFNGKDGSMGFKNGQEYILSVEYSLGRSTIRIRMTTDLDKSCMYDSIGAFLDNWNNIRKYDA